MTKKEHIAAGYLIPGQTWPNELGWLYELGLKSTAHAEVGTYCGKSLWATVGGMKRGSTVYAIDNGSFLKDDALHPHAAWGGKVYEATLDAIRKRVPWVTVLPVRDDSFKAAQDLARSGVKLDSVFIDGCHGYAECCADIEAYLPLVRPGGVLCGHDYCPRWPGVMDAVNYSFGDNFTVPVGRIWCHRVSG